MTLIWLPRLFCDENIAVRLGQENAWIAKTGGVFLDPETIRNVELRLPRP